MFSKINVRRIIREHLQTLAHASSGRVQTSDLLLFFGVPAAMAISLIGSVGPMGSEIMALFATVHAILGGLMFNLLVLVYQLLSRFRNGATQRARRVRVDLLTDTYQNVSFLVLLSVTVLVLLVANALAQDGVAASVLSAAVYYLSITFVLTLLMVLKRIHVLLSKEIEDITRDDEDASIGAS